MLRFLKLTSLLIFLFMAFAVVSSSQKAFATCNKNPTLLYDGKTDKASSVIYHLRIRNNCSGAENFNIRVSELPSEPRNFQGNWKIENGATNTVFKKSVNGTESVEVTVARNTNIYQPDGNYYWVVINAAIASDSNYKDSISLVYIIVNKGQVSGIVYVDENNNGLDSKDTRLAGQTIKLDPQGANKENKTNNNGVYKFDNLKLNSDHTIRLTNINNCRYIVAGNNPKTGVNAGLYTNDVNFKLTNVNYRIFGTIYSDLNGDGDANDTGEGIYKRSVKISTPGIGKNATSDPATGEYVITNLHDIGEEQDVVLSGLRPGETVVDGATKITKIECGNKRINFYIVPSSSTFLYSIGGVIYVDDGDGVLNTAQDAPYTGAATVTATNIANNISSSTDSLDNSGRYAIQNIQNGNYRVSIRDLDENYTAITGTVNGVSINNGNRTGINFLVRTTGGTDNPSSGKWFQGVGGDMRVDTGLSNIIPSGMYFSTSDSLMQSGIVFASNPFTLGGDNTDKANENKWLVMNHKFAQSAIKTSYAQIRGNLVNGGVFKNNISIFGDDASPCGSGGPTCNLKSIAGGIYTADGNVTIDNSSEYNFRDNSDYIILIKGNLRINNNITVPRGSTALFSATGNITFGPNLTRADGIYSADNDVKIESGPDPDNTEQLIIQGSVIANAGKKGGAFISDRNLGADNGTRPGVQIIYRPDFILNAPELLRYRNYSFKEIAPNALPRD